MEREGRKGNAQGGSGKGRGREREGKGRTFLGAQSVGYSMLQNNDRIPPPSPTSMMGLDGGFYH